MIEAFLEAAANDPVYVECSAEIIQFLLSLDEEERNDLIRGYLNERLQRGIERLEHERAELQESIENLQRQNQELRENDDEN